jgi:hypothetical protein
MYLELVRRKRALSATNRTSYYIHRKKKLTVTVQRVTRQKPNILFAQSLSSQLGRKMPLLRVSA